MSETKRNVGFVELELRSGVPTDPTFHELLDTGAAAEQDLLPDAVPKLQPWHRRTLRIALAMKGGLSLAVWIGGAIAELDILRRIRIYRDGERCRAIILHMTDDAERKRGHADEHLIQRAEHYARLLASRGYDRVEFDVLAGASAGGLNGVLYAVAQRAGVGFDTILDTWLETGSAWGLLQTGKPGRFDSVMRGDGYFWPEVSNAITRIIERRDLTSPLRADQVVVDLSATLLDAVDSSDRTTAEGRAQFRFVGGEDRLEDRAIPPRDHGPLTARDFADISRIAYAARSTSSFPFVFEPALIYSGSHPLAGEHGWGDAREPCEALDAPDMRMVFNAHRADAATQPFRVGDGGILDNIPIDRALNAVRNMPADEHSNRAILYLDPSPKETTGLFRRPTDYEGGRPTLHRDRAGSALAAMDEPIFTTDAASVRNDVGSRVIGTVLAALRKRSARESRDDEIEEVDLVRATTSVAKARNEVLATRINGHAMDADEERKVAAAYARYRATSDFELLAPALLHPGEWLLGTDLAERPELVALDRLGIVHIETAFRAYADELQSMADDAYGPSTAGGRQALVDASLSALSWIRAIEQTAFHSGVLDALDAKLPHRPIDDDPADVRQPLPPAAPRAFARRKLSRVIRNAARGRDAAILSTLRKAQREMQAHRVPTGGSLGAVGAAKIVRRWTREDTAEDLDRTAAWVQLDDVVAWLLRASTEIAGLAPTRWARSPWSQLEEDVKTKLRARQLPLLFGGSGIPQPISSIRFHRIGSDVQPAKPLEYRKLIEDQLLRGYRSALARSSDELDAVTVGNCLDERSLRSTAKLAGLRAANLAGFLSAHWRRNDWWWGRLDGASGIVEFLSSLPPAPPKRSAESLADTHPIIASPEPEDPDLQQERLLQDVHDALLVQIVDDGKLLSVPEDSPTRSDPAAARERFVRGTQGFDSLSDAYRVAIVSRTIRATSTALTQGIRASSPRRFLHWLLRPVAALLPALVSVPRLILLAGLFVCAALTVWPMTRWSAEDRSPTDSTVVASLITAVAIVVLVAGRLVAAAAARRRHDRRIIELTGTKRWSRAVIARAKRRAKSRRRWLILATALLGIALVIVEIPYGMDTVLFWAILVAFIATGEATAHALQTVPPTLTRTSSKVGIATFAAVTAVVVALAATTYAASLPYQPIDWTSYPTWPALGVHVLGATIISAAVAATMLAGAYRHRRKIIAPVLWTAAAAGVASVVVAFLLTPFPADVGHTADLLVVGWCAGTALWWAPWWRGRQTEPGEGPRDDVNDLDWTDTRAGARTSTATAGAEAAPIASDGERMPGTDAARSPRPPDHSDAHVARPPIPGASPRLNDRDSDADEIVGTR